MRGARGPRVAHETIEYHYAAMPVKVLVHEPLSSANMIPPHWHASLEITYLLSGTRGSFTLGAQKEPFVPGSVFVVNPLEVHSSFSPADDSLRALTLQYSYEYLHDLLPGFGMASFDNFLHVEQENESFGDILNELWRTVNNEEDQLHMLKLASLSMQLLLFLAQNHMYARSQSADADVAERRRDTVRSVISYVYEHSEENLSLPVIADAFFLSPGYLGRIFGEQVGISLMHYVGLVRASAAQKLLVQTDKSVKAISEEVGFPNEKSFRRVFLESYGQTPKRYRMDVGRAERA